MPFPISIDNKITLRRKYNNISSERYVIQHIESYLKSLGLRIIKKTESRISFHKGSIFFGWNRKDKINNGTIKILVDKDNLIIRIQTLTLPMFFIVIIMILFLVTQIQDLKERYIVGLIFFLWLFGMNYMIRFNAHRRLKKDIMDLMEQIQ